MFDEEPDGDPHGECALEIKTLQARIAELEAERDALKVDAERRKTALRIAREGYAGERATGLPVLEEWRERTIAIIDAAMNQPKESGQ